MACVDGIHAASLFQNLLAEVLVLNIPILPVSDNASLINAVYSSKTVTDKRLRVDLGYLKSFIDEKNMEKMIWVPSKLQLADCLTKNSKRASNNLRLCLKHGRIVAIRDYLETKDNFV